MYQYRSNAICTLGCSSIHQRFHLPLIACSKHDVFHAVGKGAKIMVWGQKALSFLPHHNMTIQMRQKNLYNIPALVHISPHKPVPKVLLRGLKGGVWKWAGGYSPLPLGTTTQHHALYWAIPFNKGTPPPPHGWFFSVCPRGYWHARISPYSLVNFSKFSVILRKLLSVLGVSRQNFCPRVGK